MALFNSIMKVDDDSNNYKSGETKSNTISDWLREVADRIDKNGCDDSDDIIYIKIKYKKGVFKYKSSFKKYLNIFWR